MTNGSGVNMPEYVIRFLPDYSCTSLWPDNEKARSDFKMPIEYTELNLSAELIQRLETFDDRIMDIIDWSNPAGPSPLSKEERIQLYNDGKQLLELVRKELGDNFEVLDKLDWIYPKED